MDFLLHYEAAIRLTAFFGIFAVIAIMESLKPRRHLNASKWDRWRANLTLVIFNTILLRLLFPAAAVGVALWAQQQGWGLLNTLSLPLVLAIITAVIILDFTIWLQHVVVHAIPLFWRLHRVHHADLDYDVTTGSRFHPLEILLSMLIKCMVILLLGPPLVAVILFEVLLNASAMFNHGNFKIPEKMDKILRWMIVTPDMHRVHHSVEDNEANSNFGFFLPWWDYLFGTYKSQPALGHKNMQIGIHHYHKPQDVIRLTGLLILPFKRLHSGYTINRRRWNKSGES